MLYHSTQPAVAYSMSASDLYGPSRKIDERIHWAALYSPLIVSGRVVVGVADAAVRWFHPLEGEACGERYRGVLAVRIAVADH